MKQIERIRQMSVEELAKWLMEDVEQQNFSVEFCEERFCPLYEDHCCTDENCLKAAVPFLTESSLVTPQSFIIICPSLSASK